MPRLGIKLKRIPIDVDICSSIRSIIDLLSNMNMGSKNRITSQLFLLLIGAKPLSAYAQEAISQETVITAPSEKVGESLVSKRLKSSDTAALLTGEPGVALATEIGRAHV